MENEQENDLLPKARDKRGWTQRQLAKEMRVAESTVRSWESGKHFPSAGLRKRLCHLFQMTPEELGLVPKRTKRPKAQTRSEPSQNAQACSYLLDKRGPRS